MQMLKKYTLYYFALLGIMVLFNACDKEYESIESVDDAKIQTYIKQNNLTMTKDPTGFYYQVLEPGTGNVVLNKDSIFFNLNGQSLSGTTYFATSQYTNEGTYLGYISPDSYRLALQGIKRGGKVRVILPSYLAYGKNGSGSIPSNEIISTTINVLPENSQREIDDKLIRDFLTAKGINNAVKSANGIYYVISSLGTGTTADIASTVATKYTGRFLTGSVFDQTSGDVSYSFLMNDVNVISGWRKGLLGYSKGTKIRLFIPSHLAYGTEDSRNQQTGVISIPKNSVLDFDIEITDVTN